MGLVEEEDQLGLVQVSRLRQDLEELRHHPQQEAGVEGGVAHQGDAVQDVDDAPALVVPADPVVDVQGGLAEEEVAPLVLQGQQGPDDAAQGLGRDVAVVGEVFRPVLAHIAEHGPQVLQVDELEALVVGDAEDDVQDPLLGLAQSQDKGEQVRTHVGDGGPDRVPGLLVDVPEDHGVAGVVEGVPDGELVDALLHPLVVLAGAGQAGHVPLHVAEEDGDPRVGKGLGHDLHGDGLAGAAGPGDEAVAVAHAQVHHDPFFAGQT